LETLKSFENAAKAFYGDKFQYYLDSMISEYNKLQNKLDGHKEILNDLRDTNDSLINTKTNSTIKTLTVMSFIMLPLSLITGLFGMNMEFTIIQKPDDFIVLIGGMVVLGIIMYIFFKLKKWI
nr:hypothetical protein [Candidatus Paceibacterota bacterium]